MKHPSKIIFLPIETLARELDAKALISYAALLNDYQVVIGRTKYVKQFAQMVGYGVYWAKSHNKKNFPFFAESPAADSFYKVALDEEGLIFVSDEILLRRFKSDAIDFLDTIFLWGNYQRNLLASARSDLANKMTAIGNARFDLLRPEYRILYEPAKTVLQKKWGDYIVIDTNFAPGNFDSRDKLGYIKTLESEGRIKNGTEMNFYVSRMNYYKRLFDYYVAMVKELSQQFPAINFILRPHPSEDHEHWRQELAGFQNIYVVYEGNAIEWINGALAMVHTGCTTGMEGWALNKPVFRYNPEPVAEFESALPNQFGYNHQTLDELSRSIRLVSEGKLQGTFDEQKHLAKSYLESIDGESFFERLKNLFHEGSFDRKFLNENGVIVKSPADVVLQDRWKIDLRIIVSRFFSKHTVFMEKIVGKKITARFSSNTFQKFSYLSKNYIVNMFKNFDEVHHNNLADHLVIRKLCADTYIITSQKLPETQE